MKKILIIAMILVASSLKMMAGPIVTVHIKIGKNSEDCGKFGICWKESGVSVDLALVANGTQDGTLLQINDNTGNLDITIPSSIWKEKSTFFNGNKVVFEEEVNFGKKISSLLRAPGILIVKPGSYTFKKDNAGNVVIMIPQK